MANRLERHHVKPRGAGGPDDDYNILKLCRVCHDRWHYRGYCDFFEEYPHVLDILEKRGWELVDMLGKICLISPEHPLKDRANFNTGRLT